MKIPAAKKKQSCFIGSAAKIILFASVFAGILFLLNFSGAPKAVKNFFYSLTSPLQSFFWRSGDDVFDFSAGFFAFRDIKKENELLRSKNKELLSELLMLRAVKSENEFLRNATGIGLEKDFNLILANVLAKDVFRDSILIDKGLIDGIKKNQPVLTGQKNILGRIGEVYDNFSEVILISSPEISFDAKISDTDIAGVVKGKGRLEVGIEFIPKDKELKTGDFVVSTALGGIFPEGIITGEIQEIRKSDTDPFQSAKIKPGFDINALDKLFIIKNFRSFE